MVDSSGVTSELLSLIHAATRSVHELYTTVQSFRNYPQAVHQVQEVLKDTDGILICLKAHAEDNAPMLMPLKLPLSWYILSCEDVKAKITTYVKDSEEGGRRSFRKWVKLRFLGGDIDDFINQLAMYKSTFAIALADANLRSNMIDSHGASSGFQSAPPLSQITPRGLSPLPASNVTSPPLLQPSKMVEAAQSEKIVPMCFILVPSVVLVIMASTTVGFYYTMVWEKMSDGFTAASWVIAVGALALAGPTAFHYPKCVCWKQVSCMGLRRVNTPEPDV